MTGTYCKWRQFPQCYTEDVNVKRSGFQGRVDLRNFLTGRWAGTCECDSMGVPGSRALEYTVFIHGEWQHPRKRKGVYPVPSVWQGSLSHYVPPIRERAREIERGSRRLSSSSRRRISGVGISGSQPPLPTPPTTNVSQRRQLAQTSGVKPQSERPNLGPSARSIAQRARRERERQQRLSSADGNVPPTPPASRQRRLAPAPSLMPQSEGPIPGPMSQSEGPNLGPSARSVAWRARRECERRQRLISVDAGRTQPGKPLTMGHPGVCLTSNLTLQDHHHFSPLHGRPTGSRLKSTTLGACQRCASTDALHWKAERLSMSSKGNVLFGTRCNSGCVQLPPLDPPLIPTPSGYNSFRIKGELCHWFGSLAPSGGEEPVFTHSTSTIPQLSLRLYATTIVNSVCSRSRPCKMCCGSWAPTPPSITICMNSYKMGLRTTQ